MISSIAALTIKFSSFDELQSLRKDWDDLFNASESDSHYLTFDFICLWYTCFASPSQIRIYCIAIEGRIIGFLPMVLKVEKGVRTLSSLTNYHCMHSGPLVRTGCEHEFKTKLLDELYRGWPEWDLLKLEYCNDFDRFPQLFSPEILDDKRCRWRFVSEPTYTVQIDKGFNEYLAKISTNARKNYNKMRNRLDREGAWNVRLYRGEEAFFQWDTFVELENSGWKGSGGSSIKQISGEYQDFYKGLVSLLARRDQLIISLLWFGGQAIAGGFMYREGEVLHMFKAGYDTDFHSLSPSNVLFIETVKNLCEHSNGARILHLFTGDSGYKHKLMQREYNSHVVLHYRRTVRGFVLFRYHLAKARLKLRSKI